MPGKEIFARKMSTTVLPTPATMVLHVLTEKVGIRANVRLDLPDQFVKSTSMNVTRHHAAMVPHAEIKSTVLNASAPRENLEHVAKMTSTTGGTAVCPVESSFSDTIPTCKKTATRASAPMAHARAQRSSVVRTIAGITLKLAAVQLAESAYRKKLSTASVPLVVVGPSVKVGRQTLSKATRELVTKCVFPTVRT